MSVGFEYPLGLLLLIPLALLFWYCQRRQEKSFLIHPWAEHLRARAGSGKFRSRLLLFCFALAALAMTLVIAQAWYGRQEVRTVEKGRMITFYFDVSGSTWGEVLKAETEVARKLIKAREEDKISVVFFASEASATLFGIPPDYLTDELVQRMAGKLGGSTNASIALFQGFVSAVREEHLLEDKDIANILARITATSYGTSLESQRLAFSAYLTSLLERRKPLIADRLGIVISDCMLGFEHYDVTSIMALHKAMGMRNDIICIGSNGVAGMNSGDTKVFVDAVRESGGGIHVLDVSQKSDVEKSLMDVVRRIDASKPRDIMALSTLHKRSIADWCFAAALCFLAAGMTVVFAKGVRG